MQIERLCSLANKTDNDEFVHDGGKSDMRIVRVTLLKGQKKHRRVCSLCHLSGIVLQPASSSIGN